MKSTRKKLFSKVKKFLKQCVSIMHQPNLKWMGKLLLSISEKKTYFIRIKQPLFNGFTFLALQKKLRIMLTLWNTTAKMAGQALTPAKLFRSMTNLRIIRMSVMVLLASWSISKSSRLNSLMETGSSTQSGSKTCSKKSKMKTRIRNPKSDLSFIFTYFF